MSQSNFLDFHINKKNNPGPINLKRPEIVGYWSIDEFRKFHHDASQLRYFIPFATSSVHCDLNEGISKVIRKQDNFESEKLTHILTWILMNKNKILANPEESKLLRPDFICYRHSLRKLLESPYFIHHGWIICAAKFMGNIYLCLFTDEDDKAWERNADIETKKRLEIQFNWMNKFRHYLLSDNPLRHNDTSTSVSQVAEFCCLFQTQLNNHSLLYSATVDGLISTEKFEEPLPLDKLQFMASKLNKLHATYQQDFVEKRFKNLRWCANGYLIGEKDIVIGYRDEQGILRHLKKRKLAELQAESKDYWNLHISLDICDNFLNHVKNVVKEDYDRAVYKFEKLPRSNVVDVKKLPPSSEYAFLPESYTSALIS